MMDLDRIRKAARMMREAQEMLSGGPLDFYLTEMAAAYELLMTRYAPFRVGDRVRLKAAPEITNKVRPSWLYWKLLIVPGAQGVVVSADCGTDGFRFGVKFDGGHGGAFVFGEGDLEADA